MTKTTTQVLGEGDLDLTKLMTKYTTKSNVIRFLDTQKFTRSQISKFMDIRYQHVRNVLTQPLKKVS